jgi:hypothetical protein
MSRYTKWMPLANYESLSYDTYIVFMRGNKKTGMIYFKTRKIANYDKILPRNLILISEAWDKMIQELRGKNEEKTQKT